MGNTFFSRPKLTRKIFPWIKAESVQNYIFDRQKTKIMANPKWKSFSVFVSSTFKDMHAERDYLIKVIFPELEEKFEKHKIHLNIIDLRWGIDTTGIENEADREKEIIRVCMDEIKRCRPFFIGIIGDRYGWIPPKELISDLKYFKDQNPEENKSITHHEMEFGILNNTGIFSGSIICFRSITESIIQQYNDLFTNERIHFDSEMKLEKIKTFNRFLNIYFNQTREEDEKLIRLKKELREFFESHDELKNNIVDYTLYWNEEKHSWEGLELWKNKLIAAIINSQEYKRLISETVHLNWITEEQNSFDQFVEKHTRSYDAGSGSENTLYVKRDGIDDTIKAFTIEAKTPARAIFITGESGSGKSAILANAYKEFSDTNRYPDLITLGHAAHLTPKSAKLIFTMQKWIWQLLQLGNLSEIEGVDEKLVDHITEEKLPFESEFETYGVLRKHLNTLLAFYSKNKTIVFFLDAIDYFENTEIINHFAWLNEGLPDNVKLICTTIRTGRFMPQKFHGENFYRKIEVPGFNDQAGELIDKLFKLHNKGHIKERIKNTILSKKEESKLAVASPLWINLCLNFLLTLNEDDFRKIEKRTQTNTQKRGDILLYDYINETIEELATEPGKLFLQLMDRAKSIFGGNFVENVFNYVAISRYGLREVDLRHLMERDWPKKSEEEKVIEKQKACGWDDLQFSYMRRWFPSIFINNGDDERWNISHDILKESVKNRLSRKRFEELHRDIIKYLFRLVLWGKKQRSDPFFRSEPYYHIWEMDNKSMGILAFLESDETGLNNAVRFVVNQIENETFREWFLGLIDFKVNELKRKKEGDQHDDELYKFYTEVLLEGIFKNLIDSGMYSLTAVILNTIAKKIEAYKIYFENQEYNNIINFLDERYAILKHIVPDESFKNFTGQETAAISVMQLRISCTKKILSINNQNRDEEFRAVCINIRDDLEKLEKEAEKHITDEMKQLYFEYKGDWLLNRLDERNKLYFERNYKEVEQIFLWLKEVSSELKLNFPENIEFKARYATSLKRLGNLYHKYLIVINPEIISKVLDYYHEQFQILKEVYEFAPNIVRYKTAYANSLSDLAGIYELKRMYHEAESFHIKNIEAYKNVVDYEEITPVIEENLKIAYHNIAKFYNGRGKSELAQKCSKEYDEVYSIIQSNKKKQGDNENN